MEEGEKLFEAAQTFEKEGKQTAAIDKYTEFINYYEEKQIKR